MQEYEANINSIQKRHKANIYMTRKRHKANFFFLLNSSQTIFDSICSTTAKKNTFQFSIKNDL